MESSSPSAKATTPTTASQSTLSASRPGDLARTDARPALRSQNVLHRLDVPVLVFVENRGDRVDDRGERETAVEERRDALLVRRVVDGGRRTAPRARRPRQRDRRERLVVERRELPGGGRRPVARLRGTWDAVRPGHAQGYRDLHVGRAGLGQGGA